MGSSSRTAFHFRTAIVDSLTEAFSGMHVFILETGNPSDCIEFQHVNCEENNLKKNIFLKLCPRTIFRDRSEARVITTVELELLNFVPCGHCICHIIHISFQQRKLAQLLHTTCIYAFNIEHF